MTERFNNTSSFLQHLMSCTRKELPPSRESEKTVESPLTTDCGPQEVTEEDYWFFLEILPPRWIRGCHFIFAEGGNPFRLFWHEGDRYFARQLSEEETGQFCALTGARRES